MTMCNAGNLTLNQGHTDLDMGTQIYWFLVAFLLAIKTLCIILGYLFLHFISEIQLVVFSMFCICMIRDISTAQVRLNVLHVSLFLILGSAVASGWYLALIVGIGLMSLLWVFRHEQGQPGSSP